MKISQKNTPRGDNFGKNTPRGENLAEFHLTWQYTRTNTHIHTPDRDSARFFFFLSAKISEKKKILNNSQKIFFEKIFWLRDRGGVKDSFINEKKKFRRGNPLRDLEKSENSKLSETHF